MKTQLFCYMLAVLVLFPIVTVQSQITITLDDLEYQEDENYQMYNRSTLYIVQGLTGKIGGPYTWDFSTGPTDIDFNFEYVLPSTTPCYSDFSASSIAEKRTGDGSEAYMHLDFQTPTGRVNYGVCQPGILDIPYIFNPPLIDFPATIDFMEFWEGSTQFPAQSGGFDLDVDYTFTSFCNAYGTLTLPDGLGDFPCLQINTLEHYSFYWEGIIIAESYIRSYYWLIEEAGIAVIILSEEGTSPPPDDFPYSEGYSRMYESSKLTTSNEFSLDIKVILEGPYNTSSGLMNTSLNPDDIPLAQPYNIDPWNYFGSESVLTIPSVDIVDWILIELRDTTINSLAVPETIIAKQAAFLLNDGSILGVDGTNPPIFDIPVNNDLFAVIWHRNHLGVMSEYPLIKTDEIYSYNFTDNLNNAYGGSLGHKQIDLGVWGMFAGNSNADYFVNEDDKVIGWMIQSGTNGYKPSDYNLNKQVNNPDKNDFWFGNFGENCQVPQ